MSIDKNEEIINLINRIKELSEEEYDNLLYNELPSKISELEVEQEKSIVRNLFLNVEPIIDSEFNIEEEYDDEEVEIEQYKIDIVFYISFKDSEVKIKVELEEIYLDSIEGLDRYSFGIEYPPNYYSISSDQIIDIEDYIYNDEEVGTKLSELLSNHCVEEKLVKHFNDKL